MTVDASAALLNRARVSIPIQAGSRLAAVIVTPFTTTPGNVMPTGPVQSKFFTCCATTAATASGLAGWGVSTLTRSVSNVPLVVSTGAALMPVPPMSMPSTCTAQPSVHLRIPPGAAGPQRETNSMVCHRLPG